MIDKAFARALVKLRAEKGLSQEALGHEIGLHRTYVSMLERGINSPTLRTLDRLAHFFGISLSRLMDLVAEEMDPAESGSR